METEIVILSCDHRAGNAKGTGKAYDFYTGRLFSDLGMMEFSANEAFVTGIDLKAKKIVFTKVLLTMKEGKCNIKKV